VAKLHRRREHDRAAARTSCIASRLILYTSHSRRIPVWTVCPYHERDGLFNPDGRLINNIGHFSNLADAVIYNVIAWVLTNYTSAYSQNAVRFIHAWFLDPRTRMNPNLKYSQMDRGPRGQLGAHTGIL